MMNRELSLDKVLAILISMLILFTSGNVRAEENWRIYGITKYFILLYDSNSISHSSKDIVKLWIKSVSKCNDSVDWAIKDHPNCVNVEWLYVLTLLEIDCLNKQDRDIKSIGYGKEGKESLSDEISPWSNIIPESYTEVLYKIFCD